MSPWLSVWGLVADMIGVAIITYDVWPEYRLHRLREDVDWQYKVLFSSLDQPPAEREIGSLVQSMLDGMGLSEMNRLRKRLGLPPMSEDRNLPTRSEIIASQSETNLAILQKIDGLAKRPRPPVGLGVILVIAGFLLQLLGALPPPFVQAHLGW